jgi:hypothetical protein
VGGKKPALRALFATKLLPKHKVFNQVGQGAEPWGDQPSNFFPIHLWLNSPLMLKPATSAVTVRSGNESRVAICGTDCGKKRFSDGSAKAPRARSPMPADFPR